VDVHPACAVGAPPDFAPSVINIVTLHDVAIDVALRHLLGPVPDAPSARPSFTRHIAPIFDRLAKLAWVQSGTRGAGSEGSEFADVKALAEAEGERQNVVFKRFRNPNLPPESAEAKQQATSDFVPALSGDSGDAAPGIPANWLPHRSQRPSPRRGRYMPGSRDAEIFRKVVRMSTILTLVADSEITPRPDPECGRFKIQRSKY